MQGCGAQGAQAARASQRSEAGLHTAVARLERGELAWPASAPA